MFNTYSIHGNEIWIDAPGNSNTNRLWNDLIWALNGYLSARFDLYKFHVQRKLPEGALYKCIQPFVNSRIWLKISTRNRRIYRKPLKKDAKTCAPFLAWRTSGAHQPPILQVFS